jgi:hypothetical protein
MRRNKYVMFLLKDVGITHKNDRKMFKWVWYFYNYFPVVWAKHIYCICTPLIFKVKTFLFMKIRISIYKGKSKSHTLNRSAREDFRTREDVTKNHCWWQEPCISFMLWKHEVAALKKLMPAAKEPINFQGGKDMLQMISESIKLTF